MVMKIFNVAFILLVASRGEGAPCTSSSGCTDMQQEDDVQLIQQKVQVSLQEADTYKNIRSLAGYDMRKPSFEMASDNHSNENGYEVFKQVKDVCSCDDIECQETTLAEGFAKCDIDEDEELTAAEVRACMFNGDIIQEGTEPNGSANVKVSEAVMSLEEAMEFLKSNDADKSNTLSKDEFISSHPDGCETDLMQVEANKTGTVISRTETKGNHVGKCVMSFWEDVTREVEVYTNCATWSWTWDCAGWFCLPKLIEKMVRCRKKHEETHRIYHKGASTWSVCLEAVLEGAKDLPGGSYLNFLPSGCSDQHNCETQLRSDDSDENLKKQLFEIFKEGVSDILEGAGSQMAEGLAAAKRNFDALGGLMESAGERVEDFAKNMLAFFDDGFDALEEYMGPVNWCTGTGNGFISFLPTDCGFYEGVFETIKAGNELDIIENYDKTLVKLGTCLAKSAVLQLATPFLDAEVTEFCVPEWIRPPIIGVVGSIRFIFSALSSGGDPCPGHWAESSRFCRTQVDMRKAGSRMQSAQRASLLQDNSSLAKDYKCHEAEKDWSIVFTIFFTVTFAQRYSQRGGDQVTVGLTFASGCKSNKEYHDLALGIGVDVPIVELRVPKRTEFSAGIIFGYAHDSSLPDFIGLTASLKVKTEVQLMGLHVEGGLNIGLALLPSLAWPKGFAIQPRKIIGKLTQTQNAINKAVEQSDTPEEQFHAALETMSSHVKDYKVSELQELAMQGRGQQKRDEDEAFPKAVGLIGGLWTDICLTCGTGFFTR